MFSKTITSSARFLKMPHEAQSLYFHLCMAADDDGVVEAFTVIRLTGANEDVFRVLTAKQFIIPLNEDDVSYILDWNEHNLLRADRKINSVYQNLLVSVLPDVKLLEPKQRKDRRGTSQGQPKDGLSKGKLSKVSLIKDKESITNVIEETSKVQEIQKVKYGNDEINWVIQEFEATMGFKSQGGNKDRFMAKHLLNNYSREQLTVMLQWCSTDPYAPRVGSVEKLWYKRGDILAGLKKKFTENNNPINSKVIKI